MECSALKEYREARGLTQSELAELVGVASHVTISRWETGARKIGVGSVKRISEKTGIGRDQLRPDLFGSTQ